MEYKEYKQYHDLMVADNYFFPDDIVSNTLARTIYGLSLESALDVLSNLSRNIKYVPDRRYKVSSPSETMNSGTGDCDDLAALCVNPLLLSGFDASVIVGDVLGYTNAKLKHAWIEVDGMYFDPTAHHWGSINSMTAYTPIMRIRRNKDG